MSPHCSDHSLRCCQKLQTSMSATCTICDSVVNIWPSRKPVQHLLFRLLNAGSLKHFLFKAHLSRTSADVKARHAGSRKLFLSRGVIVCPLCRDELLHSWGWRPPSMTSFALTGVCIQTSSDHKQQARGWAKDVSEG